MTPLKRRTFLTISVAAAASVAGAGPAAPQLTVFKTPTCGCCGAWVAHMRAEGFAVAPVDMDQDALWAVKARLGLPDGLSSCHTGLVDGYVVEGHVPASDVRRLLAERPDALGLAVPGMPVGSPGMEMGAARDPYDTLLVLPDGSARVFASHR